MEVEKSDIEWLIMLAVMLLQNFPIKINITVQNKKPRKKRKPRKRKR